MLSLIPIVLAGAAEPQTVCTPYVGAYACAGGGLSGLGVWTYVGAGTSGTSAWVLAGAGVPFAFVCFSTGGPGFSCVSAL